MTVYIGGLRERLIHDSLTNYVKAGLTELGWFNSGRKHAPLSIIPEQKPWDDPLEPNSITICPANSSDEDWELGSFGAKTTTAFYIDVYGESEALGYQISGDIRDILRGKFSALNPAPSAIPIYDWTQATPSQIFYVDIERVRKERAQGFPHLWQRFLYMITFNVVDYYNNDQDPVDSFYYLGDDEILDGSTPDLDIILDGNGS